MSSKKSRTHKQEPLLTANLLSGPNNIEKKQTNKVLITILTMAGSLIIFMSWFIENYYTKKWQAQIDEYQLIGERFRYFKTNENLFRNNNNLLRFYYYKNSSDSLLHYELCDGLTTLALLKLWQRWTSKQLLTLKENDEYKNEILEGERIYSFEHEKMLRDLMINPNLQQIEKTIEPIIRQAVEINFKMEYALDDDIEMYKNLQQTANTTAFIAYIIGSIILGTA